LQNPRRAQHELLQRLVRDNAASAFGRAHRFDQIASPAQFAARVPIVEYEQLEPWIERIMRGEHSVLTREPVQRLIPTSGSSRGRKLIPFTGRLQREFSAAIGPWMVELARAYPRIARGCAYWSISPALLAKTPEPSRVPIGFDDDSAYLGGVRQRLVETTFAVPSALRLVPDLDSFRYLTLLCLLRRPDLTLVSIWHPSFFALLLDALPTFWEELLQDVNDGGCRRAVTLPLHVRRAVDAAPQMSRAAALRRADPCKPGGLWPHLQLVSCWGDGHAELAMAALRHRLPKVAFQTKGLLATEAFVSLPFRGMHPLAVTSHFFEFIDGQGDVRLAHQLQKREEYQVVVTTGAGLWRYRLGDLVQVNGFAGATPSLRFLGRQSSVSDLCGEKLAESFVMRSIHETCAGLRVAPSFAMLAPETESTGSCSYTLFVEGAVPDELATALDEALRKNPHYAICRDLGQLAPVRLCRIKDEAAYEQFCLVTNREGSPLGAIKPHALSPRTDWRQHFALRDADTTQELTSNVCHSRHQRPSPGPR
jgi:hypothetical protein